MPITSVPTFRANVPPRSTGGKLAHLCEATNLQHRGSCVATRYKVGEGAIAPLKAYKFRGMGRDKAQSEAIQHHACRASVPTSDMPSLHFDTPLVSKDMNNPPGKRHGRERHGNLR